MNIATYRRARSAYFGLSPNERKGLTVGQLAETLLKQQSIINPSNL
jgi:hypothetical protein